MSKHLLSLHTLVSSCYSLLVCVSLSAMCFLAPSSAFAVQCWSIDVAPINHTCGEYEILPEPSSCPGGTFTSCFDEAPCTTLDGVQQIGNGNSYDLYDHVDPNSCSGARSVQCINGTIWGDSGSTPNVPNGYSTCAAASAGVTVPEMSDAATAGFLLLAFGGGLMILRRNKKKAAEG